jgi:hypothetical protein
LRGFLDSVDFVVRPATAEHRPRLIVPAALHEPPRVCGTKAMATARQIPGTAPKLDIHRQLWLQPDSA